MSVHQIDVVIHNQIAARGERHVAAVGRDPRGRHAMHGQRADGQVVEVGELNGQVVVGGEHFHIVRFGQCCRARDHQRQAVRDDRVSRRLIDVPRHVQQQVADPKIDIVIHEQVVSRRELHVIARRRDPRHSHAMHGCRTNRHVVEVGELNRSTGVRGEDLDIVRIGERRRPGDHQREGVCENRVVRVLTDIAGDVEQNIGVSDDEVVVNDQIATRSDRRIVVVGDETDHAIDGADGQVVEVRELNLARRVDRQHIDIRRAAGKDQVTVRTDGKIGHLNPCRRGRDASVGHEVQSRNRRAVSQIDVATDGDRPRRGRADNEAAGGDAIEFRIGQFQRVGRRIGRRSQINRIGPDAVLERHRLTSGRDRTGEVHLVGRDRHEAIRRLGRLDVSPRVDREQRIVCQQRNRDVTRRVDVIRRRRVDDGKVSRRDGQRHGTGIGVDSRHATDRCHRQSIRLDKRHAAGTRFDGEIRHVGCGIGKRDRSPSDNREVADDDPAARSLQRGDC